MKNIVRLLLQYSEAYIIQTVWYLIPIKQDVIMFYAHDREGLACNPKYLMKMLLLRNPGKYRIIWVTEYPENVPLEKGYRIVKRRSLAYYYYFSQAKIFVTNDMVDAALIKKPGQIFINTWHGGGAFKYVAFDMKEDENRLFCLIRRWKFKRWYGRTDYMLAPSEFLAEHHARAFCLREEQMLKFGMPRCDLMFEDNDFYHRIRREYGIKDDMKILLYAPTFRENDDRTGFLNQKQLAHLLDACTERFGGDWVCIIRNHYFERAGISSAGLERFYSGDEYADVQELLCAADVLVSDYSSLIWDFSLLKRPVFCYGKDVKDYERNRGFYIPFEKWPYPKAYSEEELIMEIRHFKEDAYIQKLESYQRYLGSFEDGKASEKMTEFVEELL